jgi:hypothetical protein
MGWDWVHLVRRPLLAYFTSPGRGNRSTWRKPAPVTLCSPQIPHYLTWDRIRATAVGSQRLTAWAMARPKSCNYHQAILLFVNFLKLVVSTRPPLWSNGQSFWLQIQRFLVRFPALPDFLRSSGSGTGSTQPREDNWEATWRKSSGSGL